MKKYPNDFLDRMKKKYQNFKLRFIFGVYEFEQIIILINN